MQETKTKESKWVVATINDSILPPLFLIREYMFIEVSCRGTVLRDFLSNSLPSMFLDQGAQIVIAVSGRETAGD